MTPQILQILKGNLGIDSIRNRRQIQLTIPMQILIHALACKQRIRFLSKTRSKSLHEILVRRLAQLQFNRNIESRHFRNDYLLASRLDWIAGPYKVLHLILEQVTGLRFHYDKIFARKKCDDAMAFLHSHAPENLKIVERQIWSRYVDEVVYYIDAFTNLKQFQKEAVVQKIKTAKPRITVVNLQELSASQMQSVAQRISQSSLAATHFFDLGLFSDTMVAEA